LENLHEAIHILEDLDGKVDKLQVAVGNQPSGSDASGSPDDSDTLPLILGGAGAVLGLIALLVALSKRKTT
jgi:hypothetical protein